MPARVLIVAGSDSGGGAGIQADIKTVTALGGYAMTAVTALTAQNTKGVFGVVGVAPDFIQQQMRVVLDDIGADALKTGMLHTAEVIDAVCDVLDALDPVVPLVADPVMVAQSGDSLLEPDAVETLKRRLVPRADEADRAGARVGFYTNVSRFEFRDLFAGVNFGGGVGAWQYRSCAWPARTR